MTTKDTHVVGPITEQLINATEPGFPGAIPELAEQAKQTERFIAEVAADMDRTAQADPPCTD